MQSKWRGRIGLTALVLGVVGSSGLVGCASERDPIDRTQAGVVSKAFFIGEDFEDFRDDPEFRTKSYNIDSAANTDSYSGTIGGATAVDRVRWEVTENWLFARRSYQESPGADNRALPRTEVEPGKFEFPGKPTGTIIAAYKIASHFDIRRDYNSQTGEESNVIVENTTDRPWFQRQYMRIDWSQNIANSTSGDTSWVFGEGTSANPIQYAATNETDEDRPRFEFDNGYFDVTNKYLLTPETLPEFGVPECLILGYFNGGTSFDCTPTEIKVRHSFVKLTGKEDFEPFEESLAQRDIVGNWGNAGNNFNREYGGAPLTSWDPQYGYTDNKTKTYYAFHDIWEKSHQDAKCANNDDTDKDGTADACSNVGYTGSKGSQCDMEVGKCTIPVRDREVKSIGYWLNADAPQELTDEVSSDGTSITRAGALEEMTVTWNQIMKVAVATRREIECRRTGDGTRDTCHAEFFDGTGPDSKVMVAFGGWGLDKVKELDVDKTKPIFTTCHNPVRAYDQPICGKAGETIRLGDVRKNYAIYWPYASRAPYGGVASIGGDPLTGEMVGVTATTMMRSATYAAAQQRDIIQLALGDAKIEDLIQGAQAKRYAEFVKNGKVSGGLAEAKTAAELQAQLANLDHASIQAAVGISPDEAASLKNVDRQLRNAKLKAVSSPQTASIAAADARVSSLMDKISSTDFRADLPGRGLLKLAADSQNKASPIYAAIKQFAATDTTKIQNLMARYSAYLGNKGICFHDAEADAAAGSVYEPSLAPYFKSLYGAGGNEQAIKERGVKIYQDLLREAVKGIAFHEIGHSLGMRHNFASSWDTMNYSPQYWQLRTNEGKSTATCTGPRTGGADTCMGPRYLDPLSDDEQGIAGESRPSVDYFANTSTMEYQIERFGETVGAGTYDLHAMKTLYGRTLETFDERQVKPDAQQYFAVKMLSQGISSDLVFDPAKGYGVHYTKQANLAKVFDPARDCRNATDAEKAAAKWRIVHGKVCSPSPKNHLAYQDMQSSEIAFDDGAGQSTSVGVNGIRWSGLNYEGKAPAKLIRWPYRYGEDYSPGGYIHAKPSDGGGDVYEITLNTIRRFDLTYPWSYFRRSNKEFAWWSLPEAVGNNYFARLRGYHWSTTTDIGRSTPAAMADDDQDHPSVVASAEMFNFLQRAILTPEPGKYGAGANTTKRTSTRPGALKIFDIQEQGENGIAVADLGVVDGRFVQIDFDNDRGGSWDYLEYPKHIGFDEEKALALRELVDSRPTLSTVSRENALDGRDPYISFRTDTPNAIDRLVGGVLSEDWETIAPHAVGEGVTVSGFSILAKDSTKLVRPAGANLLFPNMGYSNQVGTGIYAILFSRFSSDMALATKMRVRLEGDAGPEVPEAKKLAFTDPITNHRYIGTRFGTEVISGRAVETGIASRMLQHANELLIADYQVDTAAGVPILNSYGEPQLTLVGGQPVQKGSAATDQNFRRYIGLLDGMRQISMILGDGPL